MNRLPQGADQTPTLLFNPDIKDYTFRYDNKEYVLHSLEMTTLPAYLANRFANQLADQLVLKRGVKTNYQQDKDKLLQEILT